MGFRMIDPRRKVKKAKTRSSQEVLDRLQEYLERNCDEPAEILYGFWEDQQDAITYPELRQIVLDGTVSQEMLELWIQDYSILVSTKLSKMWEEAINAGPSGQPVLDGLEGFSADTHTPGILNWIEERGAEFVTNCTKEQEDAISALVRKKMRDSHTVDELAKLIRPCIGLTEGDAKAVARYYDNIAATLKKDHPRMKPDSIERKARDAAQKYAERKHRARAMTIAQTESAFAYNWGADEAVRQAQAKGYMGKTEKKWSTNGSESVCTICNSLEGVQIGMNDKFDIKGKELFPDHHMLPPAHPRCHCGVEYIEIEPPGEVYDRGTDSMDSEVSYEETEPDMDEGMQNLGKIDVENTGEALEYYGNLFRNDTVENAVVIDKAGNVYHSAGDTSSVGITGIDLTGASITHNHPQSNGIVSFGEDDFIFLREHQDIAEFRCVNKEYDYAVSVLKDMSEVVYNDIYREAMRICQEKQIEINHCAMEVLKERGYVDYVRKKIN